MLYLFKHREPKPCGEALPLCPWMNGSLGVPQQGLRTAAACTEIRLHSCKGKGRGWCLWSKASLRMFLQISSIGEYSAKTCHATGKGSWTLGTSFLLLVAECVGSWPAWIKGFLIKGSFIVSWNYIFVLTVFQAYLFYVTVPLTAYKLSFKTQIFSTPGWANSGLTQSFLLHPSFL